ncbi:MAG: 16S rRNA (guanine(527)-N(7))-methyltransferase RsmG [Alphaproteobacteria bacterium]
MRSGFSALMPRAPIGTPSPPDKAEAIALFGPTVSRETWERLSHLVDLLVSWQRSRNLVASSTIPQVWTRHVADSLQLLPLVPNAGRWVDLGSGGGFPGLVIACALTGQPTAEVHLVESVQKKAAFLRAAATELSLPAIVHAARIEDFVAATTEQFNVVTARALAPLDRLIGYAIPLLKRGAVGLFPKGQDVEAELTQAAKSWTIDVDLVPSRTDPRSRIVRVWRATKR